MVGRLSLTGCEAVNFIKTTVLPKLKQKEKVILATGVHGDRDGLNWTKNIKFKTKSNEQKWF